MAFSWFFPREAIDNRTPSRADGITIQVETRYRKDGARFVISAANTLKLRYDTVATGVVFYHRFFMMQSYKEFDRWVVAGACLLLAGKVEETPKKCKDILKVTRSLLSDQQWVGFGNNPKEELLTHERILLQTIKFDLQVEHPYGFLLKFAKEFKGDKIKIEKLVQMAWTFVNDSLVTTLCIQWEPRAVAVAFIYLAGKLTKCDLQSLSSYKTRSWWRQFVDTLDMHDLDSICHQVLDTYGESGKDTSDDQQSDEEPLSQQISQSASHTYTTPTTHPYVTPITVSYPSLSSFNPNGQIPTSIITSLSLQFDPNQPIKQMAPSPKTSLAGYQTLQPLVTTTSYLSAGVHTTSSLTQVPTQTAVQSVPSINSHHQLLPPVGITTFALANPLQALQNIRTVSAAQQGGVDSSIQPMAQYPSLTAGAGSVSRTSIPSLVYGSLAMPSQNLSQSLITSQPVTQLVGGVYQQHQLNPQQQLLQQYTLIQQGVKGQQYPLMVQQLTAAQSPQQPVAGNGIQQATSYLPQGQPGLAAYSHIRVSGGGLTTGVKKQQPNSAVNNMLSRQAFSSPYYQSINQRTNQISANAKPPIPSLLPQQTQQTTSFAGYGPQSLSGQSGLAFHTPGQSSIQTNTAAHQLPNTPQQLLSGTAGQLGTQSHMIQAQQGTSGHMIQPQQSTPSHMIQPQQGTPGHMIQPQQGTPGHVIQPQQGTPGHMIQPQQGTSSHVIQPQQGTPGHMIQGTSSHVIQPQQSTPGHMIQSQQGTSSHMIQPQQGTPGHMIQSQQGTSSHMIQPQQGTPGHLIQPQQGGVGTGTQVYPSTPQSGGRGNLGLKHSQNKSGGWSVR